MSLADIVRAVGPAAANSLVEHLGGNHCYVPKRPSPEHRLVPIIGEQALLRLSDEFGGEIISVPMKPFAPSKKQRILDLKDSGLSGTRVAKTVGCSKRYVYSVWRMLKTSEGTP